MIQKSLKLIHQYPKNYDSGAYGLVVFDQDSKTAIKVFKNDKKIEHIHDVYNSEVKAYEIAMKNKEISCLVPKFYGKVRVEELQGAKESFVTECAYQIEYLEGNIVPIQRANNEEQKRIQSIFSKYGIYYTKDSAVLLNDLGEIVKIIDFAQKEYENT